MTPEDERALLRARAQTAALYEERRRLAAERRRALGLADRQGRAATAAARWRSWPVVLSALGALMAGAFIIIRG